MNTGTFCYILHFLLFLSKISYGSAVSSLGKLRFPVLLLHSPCNIFV
ncbi:unknown [Prevotella sp. CAG:487]|nr:unknown [Prevotella sp. CAG:487]